MLKGIDHGFMESGSKPIQIQNYGIYLTPTNIRFLYTYQERCLL